MNEQSEPIKGTRIFLKPGLYRALKVYAAGHDSTIRAVVEQAIEKFLRESERQKENANVA